MIYSLVPLLTCSEARICGPLSNFKRRRKAPAKKEEGKGYSLQGPRASPGVANAVVRSCRCAHSPFVLLPALPPTSLCHLFSRRKRFVSSPPSVKRKRKKEKRYANVVVACPRARGVHVELIIKQHRARDKDRSNSIQSERGRNFVPDDYFRLP